MARQPVLLIIFDGFGVNPNRAQNGWALAHTPHLDHYFASNPHTLLEASGLAVGLPDGQFGNSEAGHLTMGAGRIIKQDLLRIAEAIRDHKLPEHPAWKEILADAGRVHLVGMISDGGVHSHIEHLLGILSLVTEAGVEPVIHMITDGRDTPPRSALGYLERLERRLEELGKGRIATISGRYYAMDRAAHWERTEKAWKAMIEGKGVHHAQSAHEAIQLAYERGEGDEFIQPTVIGDQSGPLMGADEPVFLFNFRSDRMRQIAAALGLPDFDEFERSREPQRLLCLTEYDETFPFHILFETEFPDQVLSQVVSEAGLKQFHCAEKEKHAHVTYFFNGGREEPFPGEDREIVPSPKVETYDQKPEMSAAQVANKVIAAIDSGQYHFVVVNFANPDMVGHTAIIPAIIRAVEVMDLQAHRIIQAALARDFQVLLTADHGNCDEIVDPVTGTPHTQHTPYPVPLLLLGKSDAHLGTGRGLADVAPTVLDLLDLPRPSAMTGESLILKSSLGL